MSVTLPITPSVRSAINLDSHPSFNRVFRKGELTFGFIMPLEAYRDSPFPTMIDHQRMARMADEAGFSALWLRDVPFYDPNFGDTGQMFDPLVYLGYLAAVTSKIALGTAGIVLPLRDPLILAKQAATVDQLCGGRLLLGLSSGDRGTEYPAFGVDFDTREERYREAFGLLHTVMHTRFPVAQTEHYGELHGSIDLVPKPLVKRVPLIVVGRARQTIEWIGANADAWIWYVINFDHLPDVISHWKAATAETCFKPYGYGTFFDLAKDPDTPLDRGHNGIRIGRNPLIELWQKQKDQGVSHVALNLKSSRRPALEVLEEMAEYVLPHFH
jgi:luciferase-type oxidoreductase